MYLPLIQILYYLTATASRSSSTRTKRWCGACTETLKCPHNTAPLRHPENANEPPTSLPTANRRRAFPISSVHPAQTWTKSLRQCSAATRTSAIGVAPSVSRIISHNEATIRQDKVVSEMDRLHRMNRWPEGIVWYLIVLLVDLIISLTIV